MRAGEGLVHAVARERIDEPGRVADGERAAVRDLRRGAAHRQPVPAHSRSSADHAMPCAVADAAQVVAQVRALRIPAADADVRVVALGEDPAVAAGDVAELEQRTCRSHARADRVVGDVGLERRGEDAAAAEPERAAADAVGAVGGDQHVGARARAVLERDRRAGRPSSSSTVRTRDPVAEVAPGQRGLLGQEGVEAQALGHQHDRRAAAVLERAEVGMAEADRRDLRARPPARSRTAGGAAPRSVTPPPQGLSRGKRARSTSSVRTPSRASRCAVSEPAGPAPTTIASKRSTIGAYDLGMGDSSVRIEDAGDLRVRQAMIARPKSVLALRQRGGGADPLREPQEPAPAGRRRRRLRRARAARATCRTASRTRRRCCRTSAASARRSGPTTASPGAPAGQRAVRQPPRRGRRGRASRGPALPQPARRLPLRGRPRVTASLPQRADAGRVPAAGRLPAPRRAWRSRTRTAGGSPTASWRSAATGSRTRCARAACGTASASRCSRRTRRRCSRRTSRVPLAGRRAGADQHAPRDAPRSATSSRHSGARFLLVDHALAAARRAARPDGDRGGARRRQRARRATRTRSCSPPVDPSGPSAWLEHEEEPISINYTSGTTGRAEGRHVHAPRRLPQRARRGDRGRPHARERVTSGRCRCSTATAGASPGPSRRSRRAT